MKRLIVPILVSACLLIVSCKPELKRKQVVSKWAQVSIRSQIENKKSETTTEKAIWIFNDDSTYTIKDGEDIEEGRWSLEDSSIVLLTVEGGDSLKSSYKVIKCDEDSLVEVSSIESDYGTIIETTTLIKEE